MPVMTRVPLPDLQAQYHPLRDELFTRHRIEVPVTTHAGATFVRVSVQGYVMQEDLDALLGALSTIFGV